MKKKIWLIPVTVIAVLTLVLFLPIPQGSYDDGGTRDYNALTYKIVVWNKMVADVDDNGQPIHNTYRNTSVYWYPDNQKNLDELWEMEKKKAKLDTPQQNPVRAIVTLEETTGLTQEQLEQALIGLSEAALYAEWGEPDRVFSGMYGAAWTVDSQYEILVYFDGENGPNSLIVDIIKAGKANPNDSLSKHIRITSGENTILPFSRLLWSKTDNGDGSFTEVNVDTYDVVSLVSGQTATPTTDIPTLALDDGVSYAIQANGHVEGVYLLTPDGDTYTTSATTFDALANLPNGTYYVVFTALLGGNCDPYAPQHFYRYEDVFRLVVEKQNDQSDNIYGEVRLHPLYEKYPEYFNVDGMKGVEIYVWQMGGNTYRCGALTGTNRMKTAEEIQSLFDNGATLEEMRTILELCEVEREMVSIIPVRNPLSSFWYEIDIDYCAQINALFWDE